MNIDDIAKMAIEEVGAEIANKEINTPARAPKPLRAVGDEIDEVDEVDEIVNAVANIVPEISGVNVNEPKEIQNSSLDESDNFTLDENSSENSALIEEQKVFLSNLKERIEVLFAGLNTSDGDLQTRLDLTLKFLEFLLAQTTERLNNLSK